MDIKKNYKNNIESRDYYNLYKKYKTKYLKLLLYGGDIDKCFKLQDRDIIKSNNNIKVKAHDFETSTDVWVHAEKPRINDNKKENIMNTKK